MRLRFWLMHILDMETFYDHKSSQFIQAEDWLIVRLFHTKDLQNSKLVGTRIFIKQHEKDINSSPEKYRTQNSWKEPGT